MQNLFINKLQKKDLHLIGSAGSIDKLKELIINRLYWSCVLLQESQKYVSRLGAVYDVSNKNGLISDMVVIYGGGRAGLYRINND